MVGDHDPFMGLLDLVGLRRRVHPENHARFSTRHFRLKSPMVIFRELKKGEK
jgi:hypothetical protein